MPHFSRVALISILLLTTRLSMARAVPVADPGPAEDERFLHMLGMSTKGPDLLQFFRKLSEPRKKVLGQGRITELVKQLGDKEFKVREQAATELIGYDVEALPELRRALKDRDAEVRRGAQQCLDRIGRVRGGRAALAAARLLRTLQPPGTAAVLLDYLPLVENEVVEEEILRTLLYPAIHNGTIDPALLAALKSAVPARRAAAALVVGRAGNPAQRAEVRKLLSEADPAVRLRAVQGLWPTRDRSLIPVLIALLGEERLPVAEEAEDLLLRGIRSRGPAVALGESAESRNRCRRAWNIWWQANKEHVDLARPDLDTRAFNPALRVRRVTQDFLTALRDSDIDALHDRTDVPFIVKGIERIGTERELDHFLSEFHREMVQQPKLKPTVKQVVRLEEYAQTAPAKEQKILAQLRDSEIHALVYVTEVRVVHVQLPRNGALADVAFFVRVAGNRVWLMGIGEGPPAAPAAK